MKTIFSLMTGDDKSRRNIDFVIRRGYSKPLDIGLIVNILELAKQHNVSQEIRFNTNLLNSMRFSLNEYLLWHLRQDRKDISGATTEEQESILRRRFNWGDCYQFLVDIIDIPQMIVKCSFRKNSELMYVLGKDGIIESEYIVDEFIS